METRHALDRLPAFAGRAARFIRCLAREHAPCCSGAPHCALGVTRVVFIGERST